MEHENRSDLHAGFVRLLVELANKNNERMAGSMREVRQIVQSNDIVFAVWQNAAEPFGVGVLLIKGLHEGVPEDKAMQSRMSAVSCSCYEQAIALRQVCGEPDFRH